MRRLALLLAPCLLLAGCIQAPAFLDAPDGAAKAPDASAGEGDGKATRTDAATLLPLALRWARAWEEDAELVGFTSALGEDGVPDLAAREQTLDGRDALWGFRFSSPTSRGVLVVQILASGETHDVYATGSPEPDAPLKSLGMGTREARWLAIARTYKVVDALAAKAETEAWAGTEVDSVSYELLVREEGTPQLQIASWKGDRYFAALVDADAWKVLVGGEVPPQVGNTFKDLSSSIPFQYE